MTTKLALQTNGEVLDEQRRPVGMVFVHRRFSHSRKTWSARSYRGYLGYDDSGIFATRREALAWIESALEETRK